jgi:cyclopropane fatty-acyl-phospholipid synthase-like methyltransferase
VQAVNKTVSSAEIGEYYAATWHQYKRVWSEASSYAIHYGYWGADTASHAESLLEANRQLVSGVDLRPGARVLDAGCGVAGTAMWLARTFGVTVHGITISENQISVATSLISQAGLADQVQVSLRDFTNTGFPDESFDLVIAQESVCHAEDKSQFLKEASRVLKPGGTVAIADGFRSARPLSPRGERRLNDWVKCWAVPDLITPDDFTAFALDAGLSEPRCLDVTPHVRRSSQRMRRLAVAKMLVDAPQQLFGRAPELYKRSNIVGGYRQSVALRKGDWIYCIATAMKAPDSQEI